MIISCIIFIFFLFIISLYTDGYIFNSKEKILKQFSILFSFSIFIGFLGYLYIFHKPHRDYYAEDAVYSLTSQELLSDFQDDEKNSNKKYLNKIIQVTGMVTSEESNNDIIINNSIYCAFDSVNVLIGDQLIIKGRCTGYDDLFLQVVLEKCMIIR